MSFFRHIGSSSHRFEFSILVRSFLPHPSITDFSPSDGLFVRFEKHGKTNQTRIAFFDPIENCVTWDEGVHFIATLYFNVKRGDPLRGPSLYDRKPFSIQVVNNTGSIDWSCEIDLSAFANARDAFEKTVSFPLVDRLFAVHFKRTKEETEEEWNKRKRKMELSKKNPPKIKLTIQSKRLDDKSSSGASGPASGMESLNPLREGDEEEHEIEQQIEQEQSDSESVSMSRSKRNGTPSTNKSRAVSSQPQFLPANPPVASERLDSKLRREKEREKKRNRTAENESAEREPSSTAERSRARAADPDAILFSDRPADYVILDAIKPNTTDSDTKPSNSITESSDITVDDILSGSLVDPEEFSSSSRPAHRRHLSLYGQSASQAVVRPIASINHSPDPLSFTISGLRNSSRLGDFALVSDVSSPTLQSFAAFDSPNKLEEPTSPTSLCLAEETAEIVPIQDPAHAFLSASNPTSAHLAYESEYRSRHENAIAIVMQALFPAFPPPESSASSSADYRPNSWIFLNYQNSLASALRARQEAAEAEEAALQQKLAEMERTKFSLLPEKERQRELKRLKAAAKEKEKEKKKEAEKAKKLAADAEKMRKKAEKEKKNGKSQSIQDEPEQLMAVPMVEQSSVASVALTYEQRRDHFRSFVEPFYWNSLPVSAAAIFRFLVRFHAFQLIQTRDTETQTRAGPEGREREKEKKKKLEKISSPAETRRVITANWAPRAWILHGILTFINSELRSHVDNYPLLCYSLNSLVFLHHCSLAFLDSTPSAIELWPRKSDEDGANKKSKALDRILREGQQPILISVEKALKFMLEENRNDKKRKEIVSELEDEQNDNLFAYQYESGDKANMSKTSKGQSNLSPNGVSRTGKSSSSANASPAPLVWFLSKLRYLLSSSLKHFLDRFLYEFSVRIPVRELIAEKSLKNLGSETLDFLIEFLSDFMEFLRVSNVLPTVQNRLIAILLQFVSRSLCTHLFQELFRQSQTSARIDSSQVHSCSFKSVQSFLLLGMRLMMIHQELYEWCVRMNGGKDLPPEKNELHEQLKRETMERNGEKVKSTKKKKKKEIELGDPGSSTIPKGQEFLGLCRQALKPIHHLALFCLSEKRRITAQSIVQLCYSLNTPQLIVLVCVYNQVAEAQLIRLERAEKELEEAEDEEGERSPVSDELRALEPLIEEERKAAEKIDAQVLLDLAHDRDARLSGDESGNLAILDQLLLNSEVIRNEVFAPFWSPITFDVDLKLHKFNLAAVKIPLTMQSKLGDKAIWGFLQEDENLIL